MNNMKSSPDKGPAEFQSGLLEFEQGIINYDTLVSKLKSAEWAGGFLTFSKGQCDWPLNGYDLAALFNGKIQDNEPCDGAMGYLMEAGLWWNRNGVYKELAVERDDDTFFFQLITLYTTDETDDDNTTKMICYWRKSLPFVMKNKTPQNNKMKCLEVIQPHNRLHLFITVQGGAS